MNLKLDPKLKPPERKARRALQAEAALNWQAAIRHRRAIEETFLKFDGTEIVNPRVGLRGTRELLPSIVFSGTELLEAEKAERLAAEAYRETVE